MKRLSALLVFTCILFLGCTSVNISSTLADVESYIQERPDSALSVLDAMDRSLLSTNRLKAHHALLHAMALDKNYVDVSDDSIAQVAVDYFSKHGPEKHEARALYYLGLAYYYQGEYNKAIVELTKAEKVAERADSLYLGFVKVAQANIYTITHNGIEALNYIYDAYEIDSLINNTYYLHISKLRLAQALYNVDFADYTNQSMALLSTLVEDSTEVSEDVRLSAMVSLASIKTLECQTDFKDVIYLYNTVIEESGDMFMSERDYWSMAYSYYKLGDKESAREIMDQLDDESGTAAYWKYLIYKDEDTKAALSSLEEYIKYNDIEVSDALKQSLALSQRDYYESQAEISEYKAHNANQTVLIVILASLFLMFIVFVSIKVYIKRQEQAKEKYLAYINEINRQLEESKKDDYPALKRKYLSLYRSKFETIGALCEQYSTSHDLVNAESSVYRKVVSLVDDFKNDYQNREKFEAMLDQDLDYIMSDLRAELPRLKEMDYAIFSLLVIGFDVTTISHILDVSMNTIYIRKSRIRQNIKELKSVHKSRFLEILD